MGSSALTQGLGCNSERERRWECPESPGITMDQEHKTQNTCTEEVGKSYTVQHYNYI